MHNFIIDEVDRVEYDGSESLVSLILINALLNNRLEIHVDICQGLKAG